MSLSCALLATSLQQWARRYIRLSQPARRTPEKRARMRAYHYNGVENMHIPWAVEGLPTLLHLSLFLFFGGLAIFLFNVDEEVFTCVACWIGLFLIVYGLITVLPLFRHDCPYYTPLSKPAWYLYLGIPYVICLAIKTCYDKYDRFWERDLFGRSRISNIVWDYRRWMILGMEKMAEEMAEEQTSEIDLRILDWTIIDSVLGDDDSLEKFFKAIPGLFYSKRLKDLEKSFPGKLLVTFFDALGGFMGRSESVTETTIKTRRANICKDIVGIIPDPYRYTSDRLSEFHDQAPVSIERLQIMARWRDHDWRGICKSARITAARNLARIQERDGRWIAFASDVYGLPKDIIERHVKLGGDSAILAIVIDTCRRFLCSNDCDWAFIERCSKFDIRQTLPGQQHDFCTLWNELAQDARNQGSFTIPVFILRGIRHFYIYLHQGTDAAPTAFSASTNQHDPILFESSIYPLCNITSHRPDPLLHPSPTGGSTALRQVEQASISSIAGSSSPSDPTTSSKIGDSSQALETTKPALPVHTSSCPINASPPDAALLMPAAFSTTLQGSTQQDISATATVSAVNLLFPPPIASFSIPALPRSFHIPPLTNTESLAFLGSTTPFLATSNDTLPRLRARGLVNSGGMCFANSILQLLLHSPPFWDLFRKLGDLKRQRGAGLPETGGSATPLADATVRFLDEFILKEEPPSQLPQQAGGGRLKEAEEAKKEHDVKDPFEPRYLYGAMKEKEHLKILLVRSCDQDSPFYH